MKPNNIDTTNYRDHLSNITKTGKSVWIYPRIVVGDFYKLRTYLSWLLLGLLVGLPLLEVGGHPIFLFNVIARKFIFFGVTFFPQDFHLVAIGLLTFIVFIILFTIIFGRVWCGWACPQTIFMEMLFRKIEVLIEGDHNAQRRLDAEVWTTEKIWKKTLKHSIFMMLSFLIANTFLAYIIGKRALFAIMLDNPFSHLGGLSTILIFTVIFYFVFARFRELVCIVVCPYGRLQGVMLDKKSIIVAYDFLRGEPRGKKQQSTESTNGSCIDCKICVQVCPTGIDIRNGTQLECIGCTACIDACDEVMDKIHEPRGLIRYASQEGIEAQKKLTFDLRIAVYSFVLVALLSVLGYLLATRGIIETTILRAAGLTYQQNKDDSISNLYNVQIVNKSYEKMPITFRVKNANGRIQLIGEPITIAPEEVGESSFFVAFPKHVLHESNVAVAIEVVSKGKVIDLVHTTFLTPINH
jgi:cytochrome c oxidase accessory protein FixG